MHQWLIRTISHIQNQPLWLKSVVAHGSQSPHVRLPRLQASARLLNGTIIRFASSVTGLNRWK